MPPEEWREPPTESPPNWLPTTATVVLVLATVAVLLLRGHDLLPALIGALGTALAGSQVAHRVIADEGSMPAAIVGAAVTAFAALLIASGYDLPTALMTAAVVGLAAGAIAGRTVGRGPRHRF